jgi:hypothetical protein
MATMVDAQSVVETPPPKTPDSPLTSNLNNASATIDDLTLALANFSRVTSPELPSTILCCCGQEDCENTKCWLAVKSNLENRLILSAGEDRVTSGSFWSLKSVFLEVGQALLQRHEAYVGRQAVRTRVLSKVAANEWCRVYTMIR